LDIDIATHAACHVPCPEDYYLYPSVRALNLEDHGERVQELYDLGANPTKIRDLLTKETGKTILPQDLQNFR
jgi:hypothetical protein